MYIHQKGHVHASGILPRDAVYKRVGQKQSSVCEFSIKVDEEGTGNDKKTKWLNCECWHDKARYAANLEKGDSVQIDGKLKKESWTDKKTGEYKEKTVLVLDFVIAQPIVEAPQDDEDAAPTFDELPEDFTDDDSDVPF